MYDAAPPPPPAAPENCHRCGGSGGHMSTCARCNGTGIEPPAAPSGDAELCKRLNFHGVNVADTEVAADCRKAAARIEALNAAVARLKPDAEKD
jgi:hypothetical protein